MWQPTHSIPTCKSTEDDVDEHEGVLCFDTDDDDDGRGLDRRGERLFLLLRWLRSRGRALLEDLLKGLLEDFRALEDDDRERDRCGERLSLLRRMLSARG